MSARVSISLGCKAVPAVREAIEHAAAHPDHDPIVIFTAESGRGVRWICAGKDGLPRERCGQ